MADEAPNLVLEHLKHLRASTERIENDVRDIKFRLSQLEDTVLHHTSRFDRLDDRLIRIENRLGSIEA